MQACAYARGENLLAVWIQHLPLHARADDISVLAGGSLADVAQDIGADVDFVFLADVQFRSRCPRMRVRGSDGVFTGEPQGIRFLLLRGGVVRERLLCRRDDVKVETVVFPESLVEHHCPSAVTDGAYAETVAVRSPDDDVTDSRVEACPALSVRDAAGDGVELGVVVDLEFHVSSLNRLAFAVGDDDFGPAARDVTLDHIDLRVGPGAADHILRAVIVMAVHLGMQEHSPGHGGVEPCQV